LWVARKVLLKAVRNIAKGHVFDENFLMAIASIGALVIGEYTDEYPVYLDAGLVNISGTDTAEVRVTVSGLATKTVEVENIQLVNVPKGYKAALVTQKRAITLRGTQQALDKVLVPQIRMIADLSNVAATGSYNVPVTIYLYAGNEVGVIGQNNVVVKLTRG